MNKLAKLTPQNVTKQEYRQKENNKILQEQLKEKDGIVNAIEEELSDLEEERKKINASLDEALATSLKL